MRKSRTPVVQKTAPVFAALGDPTRLRLVAALCAGGALSIAQLTAGTAITRQAVTKHLEVLAGAGLVHDIRQGRERLWELQPSRIDEARRALDVIAAQWDQALRQLKAFVERQRPPRTLIQRIPTDPIPRESGPMGHRRMDRVFVQVCGYCGSALPKLAVLAASPVVAAEHAFLAVAFGLAFYAQAHARHGLAPGFWNWRIAFFTVAPARPLALLAARTRHRVGDRRVDLFLYRVVVDKTLGHGPNVRLKVPRRKVRTKCRSARCTLVERLRSPRGQCWLRNVARLGREW